MDIEENPRKQDLGRRRVLAGWALEEEGSDSGIGGRPLPTGLLSVPGRIGREGRGSWDDLLEGGGMLTSTDLKALEPHNGRRPLLYSYSITSFENYCRISATCFSSSSKRLQKTGALLLLFHSEFTIQPTR